MTAKIDAATLHFEAVKKRVLDMDFTRSPDGSVRQTLTEIVLVFRAMLESLVRKPDGSRADDAGIWRLSDTVIMNLVSSLVDDSLRAGDVARSRALFESLIQVIDRIPMDGAVCACDTCKARRAGFGSDDTGTVH